jgi:hypothetical protein
MTGLMPGAAIDAFGASAAAAIAQAARCSKLRLVKMAFLAGQFTSGLDAISRSLSRPVAIKFETEAGR